LPFEVPRTLMSRSGSGVRSAVLGMPELDVAVFRPVSTRWVWWVILLVGTIGAWGGTGVVWYLTRGRPAFDTPRARFARIVAFPTLAAGGIATLWIGVAGLRGKFAPKRVVLDRKAGRMWKQRDVDAAPPEEEVPLQDVAAVQVCSGAIGGPNCSFTTFELNLVLSSPAGERVQIISHGAERDLKNDASRLADFLRVPLLDHSADAR